MEGKRDARALPSAASRRVTGEPLFVFLRPVLAGPRRAQRASAAPRRPENPRRAPATSLFTAPLVDLAMSLRRALARAASAVSSTSRPSADATFPRGVPAATASRQRRWYSPLDDVNVYGKDATQVIDMYTPRGFVVGGVEYRGSVFLYQELSLLWSVNELRDVTPESLLAARAVTPPPALLIVGTGKVLEPLPRETLDAFRNCDTALEVLDTPNAIATFNILVQEGRSVAAAMIHPGYSQQ